MADDVPEAVILDLGSFNCRIGLAGNEEPLNSFNSVIGGPKSQENNATFIGEDAQNQRDILNLYCPFENGKITDWASWEAMTSHALDRINAFYERPIISIVNPMSSLSTYSTMSEILFETFDFPAIYMEEPTILAMYSSGRTTGVSLTIGHQSTVISQVYEGYSIPYLTQQYNFGGFNVDKALSRMLQNPSLPAHFISDIKHKLCVIVMDYLDNIGDGDTFDEEFILPDGNKIKFPVDYEFQSSEVLFKPYLEGLEFPGIDEMVREIIESSPLPVRKDLCSNIVISGGGANFSSFKERLEQELTPIYKPREFNVKVHKSNTTTIDPWIGGSILGSLSSFRTCWFARENYAEEGCRSERWHGLFPYSRV